MCEETDEETKVFCQACKSEVTLADCDDCGACPGNVFCSACDCEIDLNGVPQLLCANCHMCSRWMGSGWFEKIQRERKQIQLRSVVVA
jgi:hypothetical protein